MSGSTNTAASTATGRKMFSKGQMTRGANSGPAIMLMPPHIRATFMPNPPLRHFNVHPHKRKQSWTGVAQYLDQFEKVHPPPERKVQAVPKVLREKKRAERQRQHEAQLQPLVEEYRKEQRDGGGIFQGMNCYNTLFVGRLAYEVTERKLLREMETFGPIKDIKLIHDQQQPGKSRGYAFIEYELEEDMKRAYRAADGMKIEGRAIVVDVERGHTVPSWLPRRLGGGLGGTRLGGKDINVTAPGRFDPSRVEMLRRSPDVAPPFMGRGGLGGPHLVDGPSRGGGPPPSSRHPADHNSRDGPLGGSGRGRSSGGGGGGGDVDRYGPRRGGGGGGDRDWDRHGGGSAGGGGGGGDWSRGKRPRSRSPSPDRRQGSRRRY